MYSPCLLGLTSAFSTVVQVTIRANRRRKNTFQSTHLYKVRLRSSKSLQRQRKVLIAKGKVKKQALFP
ncbi:hypothetical protein SAMN05421787_11254 [Virgibacillus pantothenticus]|nr:hypothetical protein SAMN05421787_11254 [Virgibacillus pantothenticus]